ncbi:MAG: FtsQ-type POTRA domain-containing protein [Nitrospiraceae bacterium]|nr:MAG: FtsQ-type POTRA domain-containing protein [Nitrospiraceae bacterium]
MPSKKRKGKKQNIRSKQKSAYRRGEKMEIFLKRGIIVLLVVILMMAVLLGKRVLSRSFPVKKIFVSGHYHLEEGEVKSAAKNSYGRNLFRLSLSDLETKLKKKTWIKRVTLRKQFPDTLMISVEEAVPKALLSLKERFYLIDTEGYVLEEIEDRATPFLPVIIGIDPEEDRGGMIEAMKFIDGLDENGYLSQKESIEISLKPYGLVANMDGEYVKVGFGKYSDKLGRWKDLEREIKKQNIPVEYVDLRYENEVIVKPFKKQKKVQRVGKKRK